MNRIISFAEFKIIYDTIKGEPEYCFKFQNHDNEYMIIRYKEGPSFQRCGISDGSGEFFYSSLDELYMSDLIDNINLSRDWGNIIDIWSNDYGSIEELCRIHKIDLERD